MGSTEPASLEHAVRLDLDRARSLLLQGTALGAGRRDDVNASEEVEDVEARFDAYLSTRDEAEQHRPDQDRTAQDAGCSYNTSNTLHDYNEDEEDVTDLL